MKKFLFAVILIFIFASSSHAEIIGRHTTLNATEQELAAIIRENLIQESYVGVDISDLELKFYESLTLMQLALNRGEVDAIAVPLCVGQYMLHNNKNYELKGVDWWLSNSAYTFNCAFLEKNKTLRDKFNFAISQMKKSGTLAILENKYINNLNQNNLKPIEFTNFDGAEIIKVAVTGDMPPIDYIAPDGTPAGFNTALLSEIGKILKVNIKTLNIDTSARAVALESGRADAVFWFQSNIDTDYPVIDVPDGLIISEPYYRWNEQYFIGKKLN